MERPKNFRMDSESGKLKFNWAPQQGLKQSETDIFSVENEMRPTSAPRWWKSFADRIAGSNAV